MAISDYEIYAKSCIELARSIIIKSNASAEAMNKADSIENARLMLNGEPSFYDPYNPKTWRYYMQMAGQYHRLDTFDTIDANGVSKQHPYIQVYSLDTHELIDFTVENLREHRTTWREYQKGESSYYLNLVNKYPDKRLLIDGILNPIDIDYAVNAADNQILYYDKRYVEYNEYSLIPRLQDLVNKYYSRWDNEDYAKTDNLYIPARIAILYTFLPYAIMGLRYDSSRTIEAHSFHVWSYLGSHQRLDDYRSYLDLYQSLWFYRNIRWSEINAGKTDTFRKHIDVIMTHRNLPIAGFDTRATVSGMKADNRQWYPDTDFKRKSLNMHGNLTRLSEIRTIREMVESEQPEARDNPLFLEQDITRMHFSIPRIPDRSLPTKVLESIAEDNTKQAAIKQTEVALNEWIHKTTCGLYNARITVDNPVSGETINMTLDEALVVFIYALQRSNGVDPTYIPTITASNVLRLKKPKMRDVRKLMDHTLTDIQYLQTADHFAFEPYKMVAPERFAAYAKEVYKLRNMFRHLYSFTQDYREHAQVKTITGAYFETVVCKLTPKKESYRDYFAYRGWIFEDSKADIAKHGVRWTTKHYEQLYRNIVKQATGDDLSSRLNVRDVQGMMVRLLRQLSSYSIQFIRQVNDEDILVADWPYLRYHKIGMFKEGLKYVRLANLEFYNFIARSWNLNKEGIFTDIMNGKNMVSIGKGKHDMGGIVELIPSGTIECRFAARMPTVFFNEMEFIPNPPIINNQDDLPAWELDKFKIHAGTEHKSRIDTDKDGSLVVRGVVYVDKDYEGPK